jgi:hypothetical protein
MGVCSEGVELDSGKCKYLIFEKDHTTSCELVKNNKHKNITIGKGCVLRQLSNFDETYAMYKPVKDYYENNSD